MSASFSTTDDKETSGQIGGVPGNLPKFTPIDLTTVAPALGSQLPPGSIPRQSQPDYLDYDQKGRGLVVTMFANTGSSYLLGIFGGGMMGLREGLANTPSSRMKVKLNSVLNHCGKYGSRSGNSLGVLSILYTFYEWSFDALEIDRYSPFTEMPMSPVFASFATGSTFKFSAGPRVMGLAGFIGLGSVGITYATYGILGIPYGRMNYLFL